MPPSLRALALALAASLASASAPSSPPPPPPPPAGPALQASFVWCASAPAGAQAYVAFRRNFTLSALPAAALLHLFADSRYVVYVNGVAAARGPCRFDPRSPDYDSIDVTPLLQPGDNALALLVHTIGAGAIQGRIMYHAPGLTARLDVDAGGGGGGGMAPLFSTDASWTCSNSTEHAPTDVSWSSIPDLIDMLVPGAGAWTATRFDDSAWLRASAAAAPPGASWGELQPRALPLTRETPLAGLQLLVPGPPRPLAGALPITLAVGDSVQIDLGVMAMAYIALELESSDAGNNLQCIYYIGYVNGAPSEDHGLGCDYLLRAGAQTVTGIDSWVAHYVVFGFSKGTGTITIRNLTATNRDYPFERAGSFASSDTALDQIWTRAVNTLVAVTDDGYGSDARERNEWLQDPAQPNWITTSVSLVASDGPPVSDSRLLRQIVRHAAITQEGATGVLHATFPTDRGPSDCHWQIEDYTMQWVSALRIVVDSSGDAAFAAEMWPVLERALSYFAARVQPNGLLLAREYTSFDDAVAYITLQGAALNAFYVRALREAAYLGIVVGEPGQAAQYSAAADALVAAVNALLWNETAQSYSAGIMPDGTVLEPSVHAAMLQLDRGEVPAARVAGARAFFLANYNNAGCFNCCTNPNFLAQLAAKVGVNEPVSMYWAFNVLYAMDTDDHDLEALQQMRTRWAPMLARNDTGTLWESFEDSESCHNYGAVPAWFLSTRVLGVRREAPAALGELVIEPHLGDLGAASGAVVTELGVVSVSWAVVFVEHLYLDFNISLPAGVKNATLRVPGPEGSQFVVNGKFVPTTQEGRYGVTTLGAGPAQFQGAITLGPPAQRRAAAPQPPRLAAPPRADVVTVSAASYSWLLNETARMLKGCQLTGVGGVQLFTPDASSSYGAQWTRDFTMALDGAGRSGAFGASFHAIGTGAVAYTLDRVTPAGMAPDRVQADGTAVFAPGGPGSWPIKLAWDNSPYAALLLAAYTRAWPDPAFFCRYEPVARRALDFVPLVRGLAFNNESAPNCSFGFEDSVVLPGRQLTVSLLLHEAATQIGAFAAQAGCGDVAHYAQLARGVEASLADLFDAASGLFFASDTLETVPDVFGSALAAARGLAPPDRALGVASFLAAQWAAYKGGSNATIWQEGQARHLPFPLLWRQCWTGCPSPGTYQNGAFWATPLNWLLPALQQNGFSAEATEVAEAAIASFKAGGVMEAINRPIGYAGVRDYVASATNLLGAVAPAS